MSSENNNTADEDMRLLAAGEADPNTGKNPYTVYRLEVMDADRIQIESFYLEAMELGDAVIVRSPSPNNKLDRFNEKVLEESAQTMKKCLIVLPPEAEFLKVVDESK